MPWKYRHFRFLAAIAGVARPLPRNRIIGAPDKFPGSFDDAEGDAAEPPASAAGMAQDSAQLEGRRAADQSAQMLISLRNLNSPIYIEKRMPKIRCQISLPNYRRRRRICIIFILVHFFLMPFPPILMHSALSRRRWPTTMISLKKHDRHLNFE